MQGVVGSYPGPKEFAGMQEVACGDIRKKSVLEQCRLHQQPVTRGCVRSAEGGFRVNALKGDKGGNDHC